MRDDELDERLRSLDRMADIGMPGEVLDRTVAAVRTGRRRLRAGVLAGAAVLGLGGLLAAPVAANAVRDWLAVLDEQATGTEVLPDSEWIDLSAPDVREYVETIFPDALPIPPGMSRDRMIGDTLAQWEAVPDVEITSNWGFLYEFERRAYCGWLEVRLTSTDLALLTRADQVLEEAIRWPAFVATDADGVVPTLLRAYSDASRRGDVDGLQFAADKHGCEIWDGDGRGWWFEQNVRLS